MIRLLLDFGMVILIWMIQLIVYPSFQFCQAHQLVGWHKKYASRLAVIVIPLMLGQLVLSILYVLNDVSIDHCIYAFLVWSTWAITFLFFVPIHNQISNGNGNEQLLKKLVQRNWWRTGLWSILFGYSLWYYLT